MSEAIPRWEVVREKNYETGETRVDRIEVPGGWLYRMEQVASAVEPPVCVFVPRPTVWSRLFGWRAR